jgi:hypothetical protein
MPLPQPEQERADPVDRNPVPRPHAGARVDDPQLVTRDERERSPCHPTRRWGCDLAELRAGATAAVARPVGGAARDARPSRRMEGRPLRRAGGQLISLLDLMLFRWRSDLQRPLSVRPIARAGQPARTSHTRPNSSVA